MRRWFQVYPMDPERSVAAPWGGQFPTERYGCTHCLCVFDDGKLIFKGMYRGEHSMQTDVDIWRARGYAQRKW